MSAGATRRTTRTATRRTQRGTRRGGGGPAGASAFKAAFYVIALVVVLFGMVLIFVNMQNERAKESLRREQLRLEQELKAKIKLVVAKDNLPRGTELTLDNVIMKDFPKNTEVIGSFRNVNDPNVIGKFLKTSVKSGQLLLSNNLQNMPLEKKLELQEGEVEVVVPLNAYDETAYFMEKGKTVGLYSLMITASGNKITKPISESARIVLIRKSKHLTGDDFEEADKIPFGAKKKAVVYVALDQLEAKTLSQEIQDSKVIRFLPQGEEFPESTSAIIQVWTGVEMEEKEVLTTIGTTIADHEALAEEYPNYYEQ